MKIGIFTDSYAPLHDGVATSVTALEKELKNVGHTVYVIAPRRLHYKDHKNVYRVFSIRLFRKPEFRMGIEIPQASLIKILFTDLDIIHGHTGGPISTIGWQFARLKGIPYIVTYHTLWKHYIHYFHWKRMLKPWMLKFLSAISGNLADHVIAPTQKVKKELRSYGIKKPISVIPSGICIEQFENQKKGFLYETFGIPKSKHILLSVGRLEKEKSIEFLLLSFALAVKLHTNSVFVVVGEGRDEQRLKILAESLGIGKHVYFIGTVPFRDMPKVYADSDLFIFASHTETQGLVIIEAMASGVPVVAIHDGAFEGVIRNGYNGYMVKKDTEIFARKVAEVMRIPDVRWQMGKNAKKSAEDYSIHKTVRMLENLYWQTLPVASPEPTLDPVLASD